MAVGVAGSRHKRGDARDRCGLLPRDHVDPGRRRGRLGRVGHAERRLDTRRDRRTNRGRDESARPELRPRPGGEPVQRGRAGQATESYTDPDHRPQRRQAFPLRRRAGG